MALIKKGEKLKQKWDMELGFALFCGGMSLKDISLQTAFKGINLKYLHERSYKSHWKDRRYLLEKEAQANLTKNMTGRLAEAQKTHEGWVMGQINEEREVLEAENKTKKGMLSLKDQTARLNNLDKLDVIARRTLRLDEVKQVDPTILIFANLINMQDNAPPTPKTASSGILSSKNAHLEAIKESAIEVEAQIDMNPAESEQEEEEEAGPEEPREVIIDEPATPGLKALPTLKL